MPGTENNWLRGRILGRPPPRYSRTSYRFHDLSEHRGDHQFNLFLPPSFIFGEKIGDGEFATVNLAYDMRTGRHVAIKCFHARSGEYKMLDEQIMREMMAVKGLTHHHILKIYQAILYGNRVFLVMEYCAYGDLRRFINRGGPLSEDYAKEFIGHTCLGLKKMHSVDLVHRDLKLENILIDSKLRAKIGDMGCARRQMGKYLHTITGSYAYGAPELVSGQNYDGKKADVWSLGIILYAMVVGKLPYSDKGCLEHILSERRKPPPYPEHLSERCCQLLTRILTYKPINRITLDGVMAHPWMMHECTPEK